MSYNSMNSLYIRLICKLKTIVDLKFYNIHYELKSKNKPNKEIPMPYGYINQLPPPPPSKEQARQRAHAKKVGLITAVIGFFAAFAGGANNVSHQAGYAFIDGLVGGAVWFGIAYATTRLLQSIKYKERHD